MIGSIIDNDRGDLLSITLYCRIHVVNRTHRVIFPSIYLITSQEK